MTSRTDACLTIRWTRLYMKITGFWYTKNEREERIRRVLLVNTMALLIFGNIVVGTDFYYSWGDFEALMMNVGSTTPLLSVTFKLVVCLIRRDALLELIFFAEKHFWNVNYDEFGENVMNDCESKGFTLLCLLAFGVQGTVWSYAIRPVVANMGRNGTDRALPITLWVNFPVYETPYYEIAFTAQMLAVINCGACFLCFDNVMGLVNVHIVGQFRILQNKLENVCEEYVRNMNNETQFSANFDGNYENYPNKTFYSIPKMQNDSVIIESDGRLESIGKKAFAELKECVKRHIVLIDYVGKIEHIFSLILLIQLGCSSLMICLSGYQLVLGKNGYFAFNLLGTFSQMVLFTWTCHEIVEYSVGIGDAAYYSKWYTIPDIGAGRAIRHGLIMITTRARRYCYISAGKFTPVTLSTFISILSTCMSILSVLRQLSEEVQ